LILPTDDGEAMLLEDIIPLWNKFLSFVQELWPTFKKGVPVDLSAEVALSTCANIDSASVGLITLN